LEFQATNNVVEYERLILGLNKAKALGEKNLIIKTDSKVIAGQVERIHCKGARAQEVLGGGQSSGEEVPGLHTKTHTPSRERRRR
jgi:ribonuclease HI